MSLYSPARNNHILKLPKTLGKFRFSCSAVGQTSILPERIWSNPFITIKERFSLFAATDSNGQETTRFAYKPSDRLWFEINLSDPITCLQILTNYNELPETDAVAIQQVMNSLLHTAPEDVDRRADRVRWMMLELEDYYAKN